MNKEKKNNLTIKTVNFEPCKRMNYFVTSEQKSCQEITDKASINVSNIFCTNSLIFLMFDSQFYDCCDEVRRKIFY